MKRWSARRLGARPNRLVRSSHERGQGSRAETARRLARLTVWTVVVVFIGWGVWVVYREMRPLVAGWFEVREVTLAGATRVTREEVLERLGLVSGDTLFSISSAALAERLESHPWIGKATVSRLPPHTLSVQIVERRAAGLLRTPSSTLLVDEEGHVLSMGAEADDQELPVLLGIDPRGLLLGETRARQAVQEGIKLAGLIRRSVEGQPEVDLGNPANVLVFVKGVRFHFGPAPFKEKWDRYQKLEQKLLMHCTAFPWPESRPGVPSNGCPEIDLRFAGKVIVRERG